jgi:hypothetical protein
MIGFPPKIIFQENQEMIQSATGGVMKKILLALCIILFTVTWIHADFYIKQKQHTDPVNIMGRSQPAKDNLQEIWIGKNKMATHSSGMSMIIDRGKNIMYMVNHKAKSYIPMTMPVDMTKYMPEQIAGMMKNMMASISITVDPVSETKQIKEWNCKGYKVSMNVMGMKMNMKIWASTDVPFNWKVVSGQMIGAMMKTQMQLSDAAIKEMQKIEGYWIVMEMNMNIMNNQVKSRTEVIEITEKAAGPNTYTVPSDYQKKDRMSMAEMQQR